ncbi:hypothetical protein JMN32_09740 [Fulvivirga sp. 29W222]|uniref:Uncharacterized protein n=1 Tax=Fulvivirga marina TaxID=2494733 RepID=A0A937FXK2_9BACT|nr:hypothetical protein [Fulvivirga marina]MBL6446592.1 hypothetical protein [Fulvivirga marina]
MIFENPYLPYLFTFIAAYPISMLEYGHRKFRKNYLLLFKISFPFHLYGIAHGLLATFIYWVLFKKNLLPGGEVAAILNPLTIGLGIKGITNLNFYNIVSSKGKEPSDDKVQIIPVGPKLVMDSIEKYCETLIEDNHDHYLDAYIHKSIEALRQIPPATISQEIQKYLPHSLPKIVRETFMEEVKQNIGDNNGDLYFAMRLFANQYGLNRYKKFVTHITRKRQ